MKSRFLCLLVSFISAVHLWGADNYLLESPQAVMRGDAEIPIWVTPRQGKDIDAKAHRVEFPDLPRGVSVSPAGSALGFDVAGRTPFLLSVGEETEGGYFPLRVQGLGNPDSSGTSFIRVEPPVARFTLTPVTAEAPRGGAPVRLQILALDEAGAVVTSFRNSVSLSAAFGETRPALVSGDRFKAGVAVVDVEFTSRDPQTANNLLTVQFQPSAGGPQEKVTGSLMISWPAVDVP